MITGVHAMLFSDDPEGLRTFFRDKLNLESKEVFKGWPLFTTPTVEIGCHAGGEHDAPPSGTHQLSFYCDDLDRTIAELRERGVEFVSGIEMRLYGRTTGFRLPDGTVAELYQPAYRGPWSK